MKTTDRELIKTLLPKREADANKYSVGSCVCIVGSRGFAGAAVLSLKGALRSGVGFVRCVLPESIYPIVSSSVTEAVFVPLREGIEGTISGDSTEEILRLANKADAVLIGPGMGLCEYTESLVSTLTKECKVPLVIDADGLNALSKHIDVLKDRKYPTVLTPHVGEMSRLSGYGSAYINANRQKVAESFCEEYGVTLLLKGKDTLIAKRGEETLVNPTGNPGMATAGSGDVLSGIIVSFLAQGAEDFTAGALGAYLHGLAGDIGANELTEYSLLPSDIVDILPRALKELMK